MTVPQHRFRHRLMLAFAGFAFAVAALFALYAVNFVYVAEDRFFAAALEQEAAMQLQAHARTGRWAVPRSGHVTLHADTRSFPTDLARLHRLEPQRSEFPGDAGRHYHVHVLDPAPPAPRAYLVAEVSSQLVVRPMRADLLRLLAWSCLAVVLFALLLGYVLAQRVTAPLSRLARQVGEMTPGQLPDAFATDFADDEVGVLAHGLEDLIARIRAFVTREQEFTRDASHELRTPLAVIRGAGERLATEPGLSDAGRVHLEHVRQSAAQLEQTVATLLSLAREEQAAPHASDTRILPVLERVIVEQAPLLGHRRVSVAVDVPAEATVVLPGAVLHILLSNLVGNAFAHTDHGEVRVGVERGRLLIGNGGHAAGPALDAQAFEPFRKREGSAGFGLGLAIVRRLCDRYGVELTIDEADGFIVVGFAIDTPPALPAAHRAG